MKQTIRIACIIGTILLCALALSPVVLASGITEPSMSGLPRTLWMGIAIYVGVVLLIAIYSYVHPEARDKEREAE